MNILKLAGKQIKVRIEIDDRTGEMEAKVVDNPNGEGCHGDANAQLLKDLLEAEVPGFGQVEITDSGLTEQGFAHRMKQRTTPQGYNPLKGTQNPTAKPSKFKPQQPQEGQLDTGFGV